MKKLFGSLNMKWSKVVLLAALIGVYTGAIMLIPALKDTSFQDIGISYEWWVVFAIIIVVNCRKSTEAALKCFVFFLISQPIVYLIEIAFGTLSFDLAWSYYRNMWLPMTVLTLPGGWIAYQCKKQNMIGAVVLGLGNTIEALMGLSYAIMAASDFPHHLLSAVMSFAAIGVMSVAIQEKQKYRRISLLLPLLLMAILVAIVKMSGRYIVSGVF